MKFYLRYGKRALDILAAGGGLVLLALPLAGLGAWIGLRDGRPVLFRQQRVGRQGRCFVIYKFRTMASEAAPGNCVTVAGDPSITRTGRWLRRWKLDELPQLLNVLKGDMSLVGPRPDVPGYLDALAGEAAKLLELRPGITGPASLAFRHEEALLARVSEPKAFNDRVIFPEKVRLNLRYLKELSFQKDMFYLLRTFWPARPGAVRRWASEAKGARRGEAIADGGAVFFDRGSAG